MSVAKSGFGHKQIKIQSCFPANLMLLCSSRLHQALVDLSKGDMQMAENLAEEDDDFHLSDDDEADKMSLASDLDDDDLDEVEQLQQELEMKAPKKK